MALPTVISFRYITTFRYCRGDQILQSVEYNYANVLSILTDVETKCSESVECETVEFKNYPSETAMYKCKNLAEEICALANFKGGVIIIGVADENKIKAPHWKEQLVGFEKIDEILCDQRIKGKIHNAIEMNVENIPYKNKNFVAIFVQKNKSKLATTTSGKTCIREGRTSRPMTPDEIEASVKALHNYDWSSESLHEASLDALDSKSVSSALAEYCNRKNKELDRTNFLEAIDVTKNGVLTKGGLLFLGSQQSIQQYLGDIEYRFTWREGLELKKNEVWSGNAWEAIRLKKLFFNECVSEIEFNYNDRTFRAPNLDPAAFHEAITNAIVHRDYSAEGMISVEFSEQRLTISSPGTFYGGVNPENIAVHQPRHRNKSLARSLMAFNLVDRAGMGIMRMGIQSLVYGRRFPSFEEANDGITVTMYAEYIRPGIFVMTQRKTDLYIPDLLILNTLYEVGHISLPECLKLIEKTSKDPWKSVFDCLERWPHIIELFGTKIQIGIKVNKSAKKLFNIQKEYKAAPANAKYLALFKLLQQHPFAMHKEITEMLGYDRGTQTSRFLKEIRWITSKGKTTATRWMLAQEYSRL